MIILTEKTMGEIYLEPEEEIIKNAKEIAVESQTAEKYIFCISYEATEKSFVLSEIKRLECELLEQSDTKTCVTVKASMAQLAAIKSLNCIEKVEMADDYSATTTENVSEIMTANELETTEFTEHVSLAAMEEEAISTMCYGGDSGSDCDNSNTMQTAYYLPISSWVNGCICCPGTEIWYRFTASASNAAEYTIYTSGSLDTMGYLYSSNGTLITSNDDGGGSLNFSITEELTYGATYYVKVKAYGSNTGNYDIRVGYTTQSSSGGQDDSDCSNDQASAIQLTINSWRSDEICCPGAEMWYKFTSSTTAYYTVYTVGSLDTVGRIYDANFNQLDGDDDDGTGLNFRMVVRLTAGQTYYVKVSAYGSNTGYFSIAITNTVFVEYVSIDQGYIALDKGETVTLTATVTPSYATNKTLRWETGDASVATVSQSGVVTARGAGTTCICAYSQDGTNKSSCCEVEVNVPVESVTINTSSLLMRVGEHDDLDAEVCPTDAVNKLILWSSTNTGVVWVNEATGRVEARGIGSATIYATAQDGTGVRGSCTVQVEAPIAVQGIDICCETYTMNVGESTYLSYDIYPADATNKSVTWCSSNTSVAEVNASTGKITAKSIGSTLITVSTNDGCFTATAFVGVEKTKIYQTENTFRYKGDGTLAEDLEYNDISVSDLKAMDWINWSDFVATDAESFRDSWEYMCTSLFSTEPLQTVVLDMIDHFMSGTGTDYSNETLTEKVIAHSSTQTYIESVKNCINQLINLYNGDIMQLYYIVSNRNNNPLVQLMKNNKIYQPVYNTTNDKITGLTICLDGLWGNQIEVKSFSKSGNSYSGVLSFTLYDHFGLDAPDVEKYGYLAGFRAWYILQHNKDFNGTYKPFVTKINFDIPFSGSIS